MSATAVVVLWIVLICAAALSWGFFLSAGAMRKKFGALTDEELAAYIRVRRERDMRRWEVLYPTEEIWNQTEMRSAMRVAASSPWRAREDAREFLAGEKLMDRAARVDPVERDRRIREMEREAGL